MEFTLAMVAAIGPQLMLSFGIVLLLLLTAWQRSQAMIQLLTQAILIAALVVSFPLLSIETTQVTLLLTVDRYSALAFILISLSALMVVSLSKEFLKKSMEVHDEYYLLVLLMTLGASILLVSDHFASLFLGFELLSIALVGLVGYIRDQKYSVETGFKYLILSASASSFMLLGIAFIYSQTGQLSFSLINQVTLATHASSLIAIDPRFFALGMVLFLLGIAFKLSLVPFHFWTPDVYQGSPTPVTMLLATVSKVAMFVVLMKCWFSVSIFYQDTELSQRLINIVSTIAVLSMLVGNVLALKQEGLKRLLGYSSIAHMGYLLIVLVVSSSQNIDFAWQSALFYLTAYVLATLSLFFVILIIESDLHESHLHGSAAQEVKLSQLNGLFWSYRPLALLAIIALLSLAGVPLSMGFIGKFYLLTHAVNMQLWPLIMSLIIGSGISLFYYLRLIFALFATNKSQASLAPMSFVKQFWIVLLAMFGLAFGIFPDTFSQLLVSL